MKITELQLDIIGRALDTLKILEEYFDTKEDIPATAASALSLVYLTITEVIYNIRCDALGEEYDGTIITEKRQ